jgi:hypothetical protein
MLPSMGFAQTTTTTHPATTSTTLPAAVSCEDGAVRSATHLAAAIARCRGRGFRAASRGRAFDVAGCEGGAQARFRVTAEQRRSDATCPDCLKLGEPGLDDTIRASVESDVDAAAGACGVIPNAGRPSRRARRCAKRALQTLATLIRALTDCRVQAADAAFQSGTPDEPACVVAAASEYRKTSHRRCPGCIAKDLRGQVAAHMAAVYGALYCPCLIGADGVCDDGNACTTDVCIPGTGCLHANADGGPCPASPCSTAMCKAGQCVVQTSCDDDDDCTDDACVESPIEHCVHTPVPDSREVPCSDGKACTEGGVCIAGACKTSPMRDGNPCDDGDPCTFQDACAGGACHGVNCAQNLCVRNPSTCGCYVQISCDATNGCNVMPKGDFTPCGDQGQNLCHGGLCCPGGVCP